MKYHHALLAVLIASLARAQADSALTIYNQDFAVVRDSVPLDLKAGVNDVSFANATAHLEPDSVILRDPSKKVSLQILEQSYRNDAVSQELLLSLFEGKDVDFLIKEPTKPDRTVTGTIVRSGYGAEAGQPIVKVDGRLQFGLPGQPIFPSLGDDTILKPALNWKISTDAPAKLNAELAYVTSGLSWHADYNIAAPETSDVIDFVGWITMDNHSGKTFDEARIKLMAGDVNKIAPGSQRFAKAMAMDAVAGAPAVTQKAFEDFHLYSLPLPTTLRDGETKQVEFIHATGVQAKKVYVYDGANIDLEQMRYNRQSPDFGTEGTTKVSIMRELKNSELNHLGLPLPAGRVRFYKEDDQQLEFTGENEIDHTARDETLKIYTGNAFDLVGERKRVDFHVDNANSTADESFEIKVRNEKQEPVEIRVVEHLYRWTNWSITAKSDSFAKTNAQQIEFTVPLKPGEEHVLTYKVHYSW